MKYLRTSFLIDAPDALARQSASDILAALLGDCGYESFAASEGRLDAYVQGKLYRSGTVEALLEEFPMTNVTLRYSTEAVADQDWNAAWEQEGFSPISVAGRLTVFDARHTSRQHLPEAFAGTLPIFITATNAFGTATHHTTRMMLESLLESSPQGCRALDCGCGTGILAIAAMLLGAKAATAYDIDEWSVACAEANARDNGVEGIDLRCGDVACLDGVEGQFDLIMANINRNIILSDLPAIVHKAAPDARLLLSGFLTGDAPMIEKAAKNYGFTVERRLEADGWACLRLRRKA